MIGGHGSGAQAGKLVLVVGPAVNSGGSFLVQQAYLRLQILDLPLRSQQRRVRLVDGRELWK